MDVYTIFIWKLFKIIYIHWEHWNTFNNLIYEIEEKSYHLKIICRHDLVLNCNCWNADLKPNIISLYLHKMNKKCKQGLLYCLYYQGIYCGWAWMAPNTVFEASMDYLICYIWYESILFDQTIDWRHQIFLVVKTTYSSMHQLYIAVIEACYKYLFFLFPN